MSTGTCSAQDCERVLEPNDSRGLCPMHYQRWRVHGDPDYVRPRRLCSVEGCDSPHQANGLCNKHGKRWRAHGTVADPWTTVRFCEMPDCNEHHEARGLCSKHYQRWRRHGDPAVVDLPIGERRYNWKGGKVGYVAAHGRVYARRGPAAANPCQHCDGSAEHWAYDHEDPAELTDPRTGCRYSADPNRYIPLCAPCHQKFDSADRARRIFG